MGAVPTMGRGSGPLVFVLEGSNLKGKPVFSGFQHGGPGPVPPPRPSGLCLLSAAAAS